MGAIMLKSSGIPTAAIAVFTLLSPTGAALAGSYGNTAVRDGAVANSTTEQATVLCPRLERRVPETLAAQMDCSIGQARPAVAGARVRNNPIANFFDRFPHQPRPSVEKDDDGPTVRRISAPDDDSSTPDLPTPTTPSDSGNSGPKTKWDRLNELGISPENFEDQPDNVRNDIVSFAKSNPSDADWSDFEPN